MDSSAHCGNCAVSKRRTTGSSVWISSACILRALGMLHPPRVVLSTEQTPAQQAAPLYLEIGALAPRELHSERRGDTAIRDVEPAGVESEEPISEGHSHASRRLSLHCRSLRG